ncbi:MAG: hypothetical protein K2J76_01090, partial [Oscillospiraceae bacterium]|nr:hypothetical protein [Oscillospiraceae bacterium]
VMGFFAFFGMICFIKMIAERSADSNKIEEMHHNINYTRYSLTKDGTNDLLMITGTGIVSKEIIDMFEGVETIYVCESISGIEPNAFRDVEGLRTLLIPYAMYFDDMDIPMMTDLFFIEDNEYMKCVYQ